MHHLWILLVALAGHILNFYCDRLLFCAPGGTFRTSDLKDNEKMASVFRTMSEKAPLHSLALGTVSMCMQFFGYLALALWIQPYSSLWANLMVSGATVLYTFGTAYHVVGCASEWIYIKNGCSEEGRKLTVAFFEKNRVPMIGCFLGIALFSVSFFAPVVAGLTALPAWACVFNLLPIYLILLLSASPERATSQGL